MLSFLKSDPEKLYARKNISGLIKSLENSNDEFVRGRSAEYLGKLNADEATPYLVKALKHDKSSLVRERSAVSLGILKNTITIGQLIDALSDSDEFVRKAVIEALSIFKDPSIIMPLSKLILLDKSDSNRERIADALLDFTISDPAVIELLIKALKDKDSIVRGRIRKLLSKTGDKRTIDPIFASLEREEEDFDYIFLQKSFGETITEQLLKSLRSKNIKNKIAAIRTLGTIKEPYAVDVLSNSFNETDMSVKEEIINSLTHIGQEEVLVPLYRYLTDEDVSIRFHAAKALDKFGWKPQNDEEIINYHFANQNWNALIESGKHGIEICINALNDKVLAPHIAESLGIKKCKEAIAPISNLLRTCEYNAIVYLKALSLMDDISTIKTMIETLPRNHTKMCYTYDDMYIDYDEKYEAIFSNTLIKIGEAAVPFIIKAIEDGTEERPKRILLRILGEIGSTAALGLIEKILTEEKDIDIKFAAREARDKIKAKLIY